DTVRSLEQAEAKVKTATFALRKEGATFRIEVNLNGKVTTPMVLDTGASLVTLPEDLATRAGLTPAKATKTVQLKVADGAAVEAKLLTLPTVRVGGFEIADVPCAVMPAGKMGVEPLLGQSFLRHFQSKIDNESDRLTLTRVDIPDGAGERRPAP